MSEIRWYLHTIFQPREAIRHFLENPPRGSALVVLVAIYGALAYLEEAVSGEVPAPFAPVYVLVGWLGMAGGVYSVGRILGGKASIGESELATAVPFVVPLVFMPISIPLNYLASLQTSQTAESLTALELGLLIAGVFVLSWWARVCVIAISEAHGFGITRSLITFMAAIISGALLIAATSFVLAIIFRPMA